MKKIIALALALMLALSLAACGGGAPAEETAPEDSQTEQTPEDGQSADPGVSSGGAGFEKYGLGGIIPADAENVVCSRDEYGIMEYSFTMPVTDKEAEQLAYQNHCLDVIRNGSDNGKVYKYTAFWDEAADKMVKQYEEFTTFDALPPSGFGFVANYYYNDTLLQVVLDDRGSDTEHAYNLFLSPSTNEELPEK